MTDALLCLVAHPLAVVADIFRQTLRALPGAELAVGGLGARDLGLTGGRPANLGGISTSALPISTATGFRSEP